MKKISGIRTLLGDADTVDGPGELTGDLKPNSFARGDAGIACVHKKNTELYIYIYIYKENNKILILIKRMQTCSDQSSNGYFEPCPKQY